MSTIEQTTQAIPTGTWNADPVHSEIAFSVENRSKTRTGSSVLNTVTDEPRWMRDVRPAIAASMTSGADIAKSGR